MFHFKAKLWPSVQIQKYKVKKVYSKKKKKSNLFSEYNQEKFCFFTHPSHLWFSKYKNIKLHVKP